MKGKNITYMPAVDQLRGIAALLIIFYHGLHVITYDLRFDRPFAFDAWLSSSNPLLAALIEGHTAVALFLVLSGFIFTHGAAGAEVIYSGFLVNRILRIFPLFLFLYLVGVYLFPERYSLLGLVQGVFLQANLPGAAFIEPFTSLFWTIAVEFQFYLIFPFLLRFQRRYGARYLLMLVGLFIIVRLIGYGLGANAREFSYATILGRMDQFALGMLLALLYRARPNPSLWMWPALIGMILALVAALAGFHWLGGFPVVAWYKLLWPTIEGLLWAGFIYLYLVLFNRRVQLPGRLLARLGEISYSLYLTHLIVVELVVRYNLTVLPSTAPLTLNALLTTLALILPASIAFSTLTYTLIEKPFLELRRAYLIRPPEAPHSLALSASLGSQKSSVLPPSGEAN